MSVYGHTGEVRGIMERVESDLSTSKAHGDSKDDLEPCALNHKGNKELCIVGEKKRRKDKEVAAPDLGSVLFSGEAEKLDKHVMSELLSHFLFLRPFSAFYEPIYYTLGSLPESLK